MKRVYGVFLWGVLALSLGVLVAGGALAAEAPAEAPAGQTLPADEEREVVAAAQAMRRSELVQFNFKDMDLVKFIRFMSELLQDNIIVPPNVNAKITIISPKPSSLAEARQIMIATLQIYNFSLRDMGNFSIVQQGGVSSSPTVDRAGAPTMAARP